MADITKAERQAIAEGVAKALASDEPATAVGTTAATTAAAADPKQFFCQNWPMIKAGLELLQSFVPILVRPIVTLVIRAGDAVAKVICA